MTDKVNITAILEHIFGTSEIDDPKKLRLLIDALREMGDKPLDVKSMVALAEKVQAQSEEL